MSVWIAMIIVHGTAATVALVASILLLSLRRAQAHAWLMPVLLVALAAMIVGMVGATISHWSTISSFEQAIFTALAVLAIYTLYVGWRAKRALAEPNVPKAYTNYIGFVWIVQLEGLIILAPLGLMAPAWVTAAVAVVTLVFGIWIVGMAKRRNLSSRG